MIFEITSAERLEVFLREQRLRSADVALPPGLFHYISTNAKYLMKWKIYIKRL